MTAPAAAGAGARPDLRVVSYNIHQCVGVDGRRDPARIAEVLRQLDADVVGLQEVDARPSLESPDSVQMDYLGRMLGLTAIPGPTIHRHDGTYGNALLTRLPVRDVRQIELTIYRREPRAALDVDLEWQGQIARVIVTHLGLLPGERRLQVKRLIAALGARHEDVVVLCGDINEWFGVGRPLRWLHARLGRAGSVRTFPSFLPLFALDRIWVSPRCRLVSVFAPRGEHTRAASDHLPLVADLALPG